MQLVKGNMWEVFDESEHFCITTNATINRHGVLVMGRGIALEATRRLQGLEYRLARELRQTLCEIVVSPRGYRLPKYGMLPDPKTKIMAFQVKYHWSEYALTELIDYSAMLLASQARWSPGRFDLNFPGIGNGRLNSKAVMPVLERHLSALDNVHIWHLGEI